MARKDLKRLKACGNDWDHNFPDGAYVFPERDSTNLIIGLSFRTIEGRKGFAKGAKRGLIIPKSHAVTTGMVIVVEGASDTAAGLSMGMRPIGRPSNSGGADHLVELLSNDECLIVGENDERTDQNGQSRWPGREGAQAIATKIAMVWNKPVRMALPPPPHKDARAWLNAQAGQATNAEACKMAGKAFLLQLLSAVHEVSPPPDQSEQSAKAARAANGVNSGLPIGVELTIDQRAKLETDVGNAARLVKRYGETIRYCHDTGRWYVWDGKHWERDARGKLAHMCEKIALSIVDEVRGRKNKQNDDRFKWWKKSQSRERLTAMAALAQSHVNVTIDDLDADQFQFNCLNGTLDLRTGELRPHKPEDLLTKCAPVAYDPKATCPRFDQFMLETFCGDHALIDCVERWHGLCLTGDITEQFLFIYYGEGNNGKNVLLDTVSSLMGSYACEAPPDLLTVRKHAEHPTEIADLFGKRLVITSETEKDAQLRLQFLKRLTGNARLKGRFMRADYIEFDRTHKLVLVTNSLPRISEDTEGVWRRIRVVPFNYIVPEHKRDSQLLNKLKAEWPGILARLVRGCLRWCESHFLLRRV